MQQQRGQTSGQNWTSRQFQGAWLGLAIAEAITAANHPDSATSAGQPIDHWSISMPSPTLRQTLASDCTADLPLTTQAARLSQHLITGLHPRQPGLSWLDVQAKYLQSTQSAPMTVIDQAVTLLPLWLLISDRPDAIAYIAQQIQAAESTSDPAVCFTLTALILRHLLRQPLNSAHSGYNSSYSTPSAIHSLLDRLQTDLEQNWTQLPNLQQQLQHRYQQLHAIATQAPTLMTARHLIHSLPAELRAIATALYSLSRLSHDFVQALRCAHSLQPRAQSAFGSAVSKRIALTGLLLGLTDPLSLPADWRTAVNTLTLPTTSMTLNTIGHTLWQAWAGAYIPDTTYSTIRTIASQ